MDTINILFLWVVILVIINFVLFKFKSLYKYLKEIVETIRDICYRRGGYARFIQIIIITFLFIIFFIVVLYFLIYNEKVTTMGVILTVLVGWIGMIIGRFFGERAMEEASLYEKSLSNSTFIIDGYINKIEKLKSIINSYEGKTEELINYIDHLEKKMAKSKKK